MMILTIDVGNTQIKTAVFECNTVLRKNFFSYSKWKNEVKKILKNYKKIEVIVVASVGKLEIKDFKSISNEIKIVFITLNSKFPFQNLYSTPASLGIDRMILASGAVLLFPNKNRLIIDAGTCITYDFVDQNNNYLGGAISPGIRLRYQALHKYTAKLPLLSISEPENTIGNSTNQSIHSGVINGVTLEIEGFINTYYDSFSNFIIILTGGDADFLAKRFKNTIFANSNFLLESLNQIYQYNQND